MLGFELVYKTINFDIEQTGMSKIPNDVILKKSDQIIYRNFLNIFFVVNHKKVDLRIKLPTPTTFMCYMTAAYTT